MLMRSFLASHVSDVVLALAGMLTLNAMTTVRIPSVPLEAPSEINSIP